MWPAPVQRSDARATEGSYEDCGGTGLRVVTDPVNEIVLRVGRDQNPHRVFLRIRSLATGCRQAVCAEWPRYLPLPGVVPRHSSLYLWLQGKLDRTALQATTARYAPPARNSPGLVPVARRNWAANFCDDG